MRVLKVLNISVGFFDFAFDKV